MYGGKSLISKKIQFQINKDCHRINPDYYDAIVVKTDIFQKYVNYCDNIQNEIFKSTIFYGEFGSGKTSFFDYLKQILSRNKIFLVSVSPPLSSNPDKIILDFKYFLIREIKIEAKEFGTDLNYINDENHDETIKKLFEALHSKHNFKGFVIVVDDLHKRYDRFNKVILFLSSLQTFITNLTSGSKFDVTTYIAGIPSWESKIKAEQSLSGSIIREEKMPEITVDHAYDMLNNRMQAFSKNPDKKKIIEKAFVKKIYDELKKNKDTITFREFFRIATEELENGNFDEVVTYNPKVIPTEIVEDIKNIIKKSKLNLRFEQLASLTQNKSEEIKQSCYKLLGTLYVNQKTFESTSMWERNTWIIKQLNDSKLIINYEDSEGKVYWRITKEMQTVNKEIIEKHHISMEDYLVSVFFTTPVRRTPKIDRPNLKELEKIEKAITKNSEKIIIQDAIKDYKQFLDISEKDFIDLAPNDIITECTKVMSSLTSAFMYLNGIPKITEDDTKTLSFWITFWKQPPSIIEFINQIESNKEPQGTGANFIVGICKEATKKIISFMKDQIEKDRIFRLSYVNLTNQDCEKIDNCRTHWVNGEDYFTGKEISDYLEIKIRQNIFNIFKLFYGNDECRSRRYSKEIIRSIKNKKEADQKRYTRKILNELQFLDRKEYKMLMTKNTDENPSELGEMNWNDVFKPIFTPWDQKELYRFLDQFGDFVASNKMKSMNKQNQFELKEYVRKSIFVIKKLNSSYQIILEKGVQLINSKYYFGFKDTLDVSCMKDVSPKTEQIHYLMDILKEMEPIDVNMEDLDSLESLYDTDYREFVLIICWLLNTTQKPPQIDSELSYEHIQGPNFIFKFVENTDQIVG